MNFILLYITSFEMRTQGIAAFPVPPRPLIFTRFLEFRFLEGAENFVVHHRVQTGSGARPASYPVKGLSLGVKWPGREADDSPLSSAEAKEWVELYLHSPIRLNSVVPS
jgi:hypothetical protein